MQRRRFVQLSGSAVITALAGCTGGDDGGGDEQGGGQKERIPVGEPAAAHGLEVTLNGYDLVEGYYRYNDRDESYPDSEAAIIEPETAGGVFMFLDVTFENVGDSQRVFPGLGEGRGLWVTYGGEAVPFNREEQPVKSLQDHEYDHNYWMSLEKKGVAEDGAFPGHEVRTWIICEVPWELERDQFALHVDLGDRRNEEMRVFTIEDTKPNRTPEGYDHEFDNSGGSDDGNSGGTTESTDDSG